MDAIIPLRVLVIVNDKSIRQGLAREINKCGIIKADEAKSIENGLLLLDNPGYDVVFCDLYFPSDRNGEDFLDAAISAFPATTIVMVSSSINAKKSIDLIIRGAQYCFQLPLFKAHCEVILANVNLDRSVLS